MIYVDTSAVVKTLIRELGSDDIRRLVAERDDLVSSRLLEVELMAVTERRGLDPSHVRRLLDRIALFALDDEVARLAVSLRSGLRALDSLHLATMAQVQDELTGFVGYDAELGQAAQRQGIRLLALPLHGDETPAA